MVTARDVPRAQRPPHASPGLVALVCAGGAAGSLARYGVAQAIRPVDGWPVATLAVNLAGAFCLGLLLEALARRGPETAGMRRLRLGAGTGFLGGFTTFSTLAYELDRLLADGRPAIAAAYGIGSVAAGVAAACLGVLAAARRRRPAAPLPADPDAEGAER